MAIQSVTKVVEFDHAPAYPRGLFQVNEGIDTSFSIGAASIVMTYVRERLKSAIADDMETDEPWVLALLTDMAKALHKASGVEV